MPKLVQEELGAKWPFRALVAMFRDALSAVQLSVEGDALEGHLLFARLRHGQHMQIPHRVGGTSGGTSNVNFWRIVARLD